MRHKAFFAMAVVLGLGISVVAAQAQQGKTLTTIGPVAKISGDSFTVDTGKGLLQFTANSNTQVKVAAGGSKAQAAKLAGEKGLKITDAIHEGDQVFVRYTDVGGKLVASEIEVRQRRPQSAQPVK